MWDYKINDVGFYFALFEARIGFGLVCLLLLQEGLGQFPRKGPVRFKTDGLQACSSLVIFYAQKTISVIQSSISSNTLWGYRHQPNYKHMSIDIDVCGNNPVIDIECCRRNLPTHACRHYNERLVGAKGICKHLEGSRKTFTCISPGLWVVLTLIPICICP